MDMSQLALPKPEPRAGVKARTGRAEKRHEDRVKQQVRRRDPACRAAGVFVECYGILIVAHMERKRRHQTRGLEPAERHDPAWELCLCQRHGDLEERHVIDVVYLTPEQCNGAVGWTVST